MRRHMIVSLSLGLLIPVAAAAEEPAIIFADGFDTGTGCRWVPLRITTPVRGATIQGAFGNPVTVSGVGGNSLCTVSGLFINGDPVPIAPSGVFSTTVTPVPGPNILMIEASAESGATLERVQTFLYSSGYELPDPGAPTSALIDPGIGLWLSQEFFDDGDHSTPIDDVATVAEMALGSLDYSSYYDPDEAILSNPATGFDVYITSFGATSATSSLTLIAGGLHNASTLVGITGNFLLDCVDFMKCAGVDVTGSLTFDSISVGGDLLVSVTPSGVVSVSVDNVTTDAVGGDLSFTPTGNPAIDLILNTYKNIFLAAIVVEVEAEISTVLADAVSPGVEDLLNSLILAYSFELDPLDTGGGTTEVNQHVRVSSTRFRVSGAELLLQSTALPTSSVISAVNLGVPNRAGCGLGPQTVVLPQTSPVEAGVADDNLNQQLYSSWLGGWLETTLPASTLDLVGYPVTGAEISVSALLAPTISDCSGDWEMTLGDLVVYLSLTYSGIPIEATAHASVTFEIDATTPGSSLAISFGSPVAAEFDLEIMPEAGEAFRAGLIAIIEDFLLDGLADALAAQRVGLLELPSIDASSALGQPPGTTVLTMSPSGDLRLGGNSVVSGSF